MKYKKIKVKRRGKIFRVEKKCSNCRYFFTQEHMLPSKKTVFKKRCEQWTHQRSNPKYVKDGGSGGDYLYLNSLKPCKYFKLSKRIGKEV